MRKKNQHLKIITSIFQSPFLFFNLLFQRTLIPSSVKKASPLVLNEKGFTVIGVLVASAIGLIVVTGLSQMFANIHTQLRQMEQKSHKIFLNSLIGSQLKTSCTNTLKFHGYSIIQGNSVGSFPELRDETDRVILDLGTLGGGHNYFQLRCSDSPDCICNGQSSPCNRKWTLTFISQSELNGLPVYNRNFSVDLAIKYTSAGPPPLNTNRDWKDGLSCNVDPSGGGPGIGSGDCIHIDEANDLIVLGCGTTKDIRKKTTTAYGFNAGHSGVGENNTFVGHEAGKSTTGTSNTFVGKHAGLKNSSGNNNTFLGRGAGWENTTGSGNIFIGHDAAGVFTYRTADDKLVVGNASCPTCSTWIEGDIGTSSLNLNGVAVVTSSSRVLKKNIQIYKSFDKALEDILKTPLFTYEYKKDHPEKSRMGIIAEELPKHLRFKDNSNLPHPDWPSIYGTFWASIKALHEMIVDVKQDISSKFKVLISHVENLKSKLEKLIQEFSKFQTEWADLKKHFESADKDLAEKTENFSKELASVKAQLSEANKQLKQNQEEIRALKKQQQSLIKNRKLSEELAHTKTDLAGTKKAKWDQTKKDLTDTQREI